jgi:hypothetical protein
MKSPTVERVFVTPKMAADLLTLNTKNRRLSAHKATQYAKAMADGCWKADGNAIMISSDNVLLNGQHRLTAVIESGVKGVWFLVMRDCPTDAMLTIDCGGKPRSVGENLELMGESEGKHKGPAATAIAKILTRRTAIPPSDTMATLNQFRRGIEWAVGVTGLRKNKFAASNVRGTFALAYTVAPKVTEEIADRAISGVGCTEGDPALAIRNVILSFANEGSPGRLRMSEKILYCIAKAIQGEPVFCPKAGVASVEFFKDKLDTQTKIAPRMRKP